MFSVFYTAGPKSLFMSRTDFLSLEEADAFYHIKLL